MKTVSIYAVALVLLILSCGKRSAHVVDARARIQAYLQGNKDISLNDIVSYCLPPYKAKSINDIEVKVILDDGLQNHKERATILCKTVCLRVHQMLKERRFSLLPGDTEDKERLEILGLWFGILSLLLEEKREEEFAIGKILEVLDTLDWQLRTNILHLMLKHPREPFGEALANKYGYYQTTQYGDLWLLTRALAANSDARGTALLASRIREEANGDRASSMVSLLETVPDASGLREAIRLLSDKRLSIRKAAKKVIARLTGQELDVNMGNRRESGELGEKLYRKFFGEGIHLAVTPFQDPWGIIYIKITIVNANPRTSVMKEGEK